MTRTPTTRVLDALHTDRFIDGRTVVSRARVSDQQWGYARTVLTRLRLLETVQIVTGRSGTRRLSTRVYRRVAA